MGTNPTTDELAAQLLHLQKQLSRMRLATLRRLNPDMHHPVVERAINKAIAVVAANFYDHAQASDALDEAETLADILNYPVNPAVTKKEN